MLKKKIFYFIPIGFITILLSIFFIYSRPNSTTSPSSFTAEFVESPQIEEKQFAISGKVLPYTEYKTGDYSVSYTTLPESLTKWGSKLVLGGALKVLNQNMYILGKHSSVCDNFPALHYEATNQEGFLVGKLILIGQKLYKVEALYHQPEEKEAAEKFIESFHPKGVE